MHIFTLVVVILASIIVLYYHLQPGWYWKQALANNRVKLTMQSGFTKARPAQYQTVFGVDPGSSLFSLNLLPVYNQPSQGV